MAFGGENLNARITVASVHLFHEGKVIATHPRQDNLDQPVTTPAHMPAAHQAAALTRLAGMKRYVDMIGPNAEKLIDIHFRTNRKPALTATAGRANVRKVEALLVAGLDTGEPAATEGEGPVARHNIRGADYFVGLVNGTQGGHDDA